MRKRSAAVRPDRDEDREASPIIFFDANVQLGPARLRSRDQKWRPAEVRAELARCGIQAALCRTPLARVDCTFTASRDLLRDTEATPGFLPLVPIVPSLLDLIPPEEEQWQPLAAAGVRAVVAHPGAHGVGWSPRHWARWADVLAAARVPVFIEFGDLPALAEFEAVYAWLSLFDSVPVVLLDAPWSAAWTVLRLLETNPNLHLEMSNWQAHNCPEFLVRHVGAERVLFGSGQPAKSPGAARAAIDYAVLPVADRAAIAGGNLQRLLELPEIVTWPADPPADPLAAAARAGRPLPILLADAHAHVMDDDQRQVSGTVFPDSTPEQQMRIGRRLGIAFQCQASWTGPASAAAHLGNDILMKAQAKYPDVVVPMVTVDPSQMTPAEIEAELRQRFEEGTAAGLKPYPAMGIAYHDPLWAPFFAYGQAHRLFALLHPLGNLAWTPGSEQAKGFVELANRYPDLSVIIAHCGGSYDYARTAVWIARLVPNVHLELTLTPVTSGIVEWLVGEVGAQRVLFGTDAPMRDPRPQLGWVVHAALPEADKRLILGLNFCRIVARCECRCPAVERVRAALAATPPAGRPL